MRPKLVSIALVIFVIDGFTRGASGEPSPVMIDTVDEVAVELPATFVTNGWISGTVAEDMPRLRNVQLAAYFEGAWHIMPGIATRKITTQTSHAWSWTLRLPLGGPDAFGEVPTLHWRIKAVATSFAPLEIGRVTDASVWRTAQQSPAVEVWRASFIRTSLHIARVGASRVTPSVPVPVSQYEALKVETDGVPSEAFVQPFISTTKDLRIWPQPSCESVRGRAECTAVFGRAFARGGGFVEPDLQQSYTLWVGVVTRPLPISNEGIELSDWSKFQPFIKSVSERVKVVRSIPLDGVRVAIDMVGAESDGHRWLVPPVARVTGSFSAGPRYVQRRTEVVTLLARSPADASWTVAGTTRLTLGNRAIWTVFAATLGAPGEHRLIAVVSLGTFPPDKPVTEALLGSALAVSAEETLRVVAPRP